MRFAKVALLASLATPIISSPLNSNTNKQHDVALAAAGMAKQPAAHKPALIVRQEDDTEEEPEESKDDDDDDDNDVDAQKIRELNFAKSFLAALDQFIRDSAATQDPDNSNSSLIAAPLVSAMNATINELISPSNLTVSWTNTTETAEKKKKRQNSSWEFSHGRRLPPCPGWPAKRRYNATHSVEWDFFSGTTYEPLNPKCPVSNGSV